LAAGRYRSCANAAAGRPRSSSNKINADQCRLGTIARAADDVVTTDHYDRLALDRTVDTVSVHHRQLTAQVVSAGGMGNGRRRAFGARHSER
jgi:NAD-specific glutamate dehydrogenase